MRISDWSSDVCSSDLPLGSAVEEVHGRPEEIVEVGFEARVFQRDDQRVEDVGDGARHRVAVGQEPLIGFIGKGPIAMKLTRSEERRVGKEGVRRWRYRWTP